VKMRVLSAKIAEKFIITTGSKIRSCGNVQSAGQGLHFELGPSCINQRFHCPTGLWLSIS